MISDSTGESFSGLLEIKSDGAIVLSDEFFELPVGDYTLRYRSGLESENESETFLR